MVYAKRLLLLMLLLLIGGVLTAAHAAPMAAQCTVRADWQPYNVQRGDTLARIARRFRVSLNELISGNCLSNPNIIYVGQRLVVPSVPSTSVTAWATFQEFEGGQMIWRSDTGLIWVLAHDGRAQTYPTLLYGWLPNNPVRESAPLGRGLPVNGFGKVWGNYPMGRAAMGWAISGEQGALATIQTTGGLTYLSLPNRQPIQITGDRWTYAGGGVPTVTAVPVRQQILSTFQQFENGFMTWRIDNGTIYVFVTDGQFFQFPSSTYASMSDNVPITTPVPPGRQRPIMGFGRVWSNYANIRAALGWAAAGEQSYTMSILSPIDGNPQRMNLTIPNGSELVADISGWWRLVSGALPPVPPVTPQPTAQINSFRTDVLTYQPGGSLTLTWDITGVQYAVIEVTDQQFGTLMMLYDGLPIVGSLPITVPSNMTNGVRFTLWGVNGAPGDLSNLQRVVNRELTLPINAAQPLPATPTPFPTVVSSTQPATINTQAAYQPFERGFMIWLGSSGQVYVFLQQDSRVLTYEQWAYEALPDNPVTDAPPSGYVSPINGFGRVWGNYNDVRAIGWAIASEQGYTANFSLSNDGIIVSLPDGRVVTTARGEWLYTP
jgi:hypothetical protein